MDLVQRTLHEAFQAAYGTSVKSRGMTWYTTMLKPTETKPLAEVRRLAAAYPGKFGTKKLIVLQYEAGKIIGIEVKRKETKKSTRPPRGERRRKSK